MHGDASDGRQDSGVLLEANARLAKTAAEYAPEPKPSSKSSELGNNLNRRVIIE